MYISQQKTNVPFDNDNIFNRAFRRNFIEILVTSIHFLQLQLQHPYCKAVIRKRFAESISKLTDVGHISVVCPAYFLHSR